MTNPTAINHENSGATDALAAFCERSQWIRDINGKLRNMTHPAPERFDIANSCGPMVLPPGDRHPMTSQVGPAFYDDVIAGRIVWYTVHECSWSDADGEKYAWWTRSVLSVSPSLRCAMVKSDEGRYVPGT